MSSLPATRLLVILYAAAALTGQAYAIVWMKRLTLLLGGAGLLLAYGLGVPLAVAALAGMVMAWLGITLKL